MRNIMRVNYAHRVMDWMPLLPVHNRTATIETGCKEEEMTWKIYTFWALIWLSARSPSAVPVSKLVLFFGKMELSTNGNPTPIHQYFQPSSNLAVNFTKYILDRFLFL